LGFADFLGLSVFLAMCILGRTRGLRYGEILPLT
jgi:hypothetical protein